MLVPATQTWCLGKDFMVGCRGLEDEEFSLLLGCIPSVGG